MSYQDWRNENYTAYLDGFRAEREGMYSDFCSVEYERVVPWPCTAKEIEEWNRNKEAWIKENENRLLGKFIEFCFEEYERYLYENYLDRRKIA